MTPPHPVGVVPCFYCGLKLNKNKTWDHLVPECKGGTSSKQNLVVSCSVCNGMKDRMTLEEFRYWFLFKLNWDQAKSKKFIRVKKYKFYGELHSTEPVSLTSKQNLLDSGFSIYNRPSFVYRDSTSSYLQRTINSSQKLDHLL